MIDHRRRVEIANQTGREFIDKGGAPDNLHVIYSSAHIRMDAAFADDIYADMITENDTSIYHASGSPAAKALELGNITFQNINEEKLSDERIQFLNETYNHAVNRAGETVRKCLITSMLHVLKEPASQPMEKALQQIVNIYTGNPSDGATVSTKENEGPELVEFKNKLHLENDDPATKILGEIQTEKQKGVTTKVFMWGFTEQNREVEGFSSQSWNDDRISGIERRVREQLSESGAGHREFMMQPIPLDGSGDRMAITGIYF